MGLGVCGGMCRTIGRLIYTEIGAIWTTPFFNVFVKLNIRQSSSDICGNLLNKFCFNLSLNQSADVLCMLPWTLGLALPPWGPLFPY